MAAPIEAREEFTYGDAAIGIYAEYRQNYRQRDAVWRRICALRAAGDISLTAFHVAEMLLFEFWNAKTGVCFPKKKTIQAKIEEKHRGLRVSMSSVKRALRRLRHFGLLSWIPQRFSQVVIEAGRAVWKCVQGPNLYHFTPEKFRVEAEAIAAKAAHLGKKKAALAAATAMRKAAKSLAGAAVRAVTVLSGGQVRTGEPAASVLVCGKRRHQQTRLAPGWTSPDREKRSGYAAKGFLRDKRSALARAIGFPVRCCKGTAASERTAASGALSHN